MTNSIVAIVGRTNVGKSTLLNRLAGKRVAVVADLPGTTRDRVFAFASWRGHDLTLVDTGGWQAKPESLLDEKVKRQAGTAIAQADVAIFVADAKDGLIPADEELTDVLRRTNKPVILAVNKVDSSGRANQVVDFYRLGIGKPIAISAYHNRGIDELMDAVLDTLPAPTGSIVQTTGPRLAIVGRPNVGKSTLLNRLLGNERAIVSEAPGTTRDSLDATIRWGEKELLLVDTAGIKRRGRVGVGVDYFSLLRAIQAINRCDVALLLIDAAEFLAAQDMHIAGYITEMGRGIMLAVNKWDMVPNAARQEFREILRPRLRFISYAPVLYISAATGEGVSRVLPQAWRIWQEGQERMPQTEVDAVVKQAMSKHPPPHKGSRQLRISIAYQDERRPSTFVLQVNDPKLVHFSYQRYLENQIRQSFNFRGVPLQLVFTTVGRGGNRKAKAVET